LGDIPLRFSESLARTTVAKAYFEEVLYSNMDSLNMLYVATTRAKDFLYLGTMFKKEADNLSTIGDVINAAMNNFNPDFATTNIYEKADEVLIGANAAERSCITLQTYPT